MLKYFYRCTGVICIGVFKEVIFMKALFKALMIFSMENIKHK